MSNDPSSATDETNERPAATGDAGRTVGGGSYKVLGEFVDDAGSAVLGRNTAGSGTPVGVEGATPNESGGYGLYTPDDARVDGTADLATADVDSLTVNSSLSAAGLVDGNELATDAVDSSAIATGAVDASELATGAVDSDAIEDGAVGTSEFATGAVGSSALDFGAVDTDAIDTGAVTSTGIADGTIGTGDLGQNGATDGHVFAWNGSSWRTGFPGTSGGTTTFELLAGGDPALRLEPNGFDTPNVVAGSTDNAVNDSAYGVTISGGGGLGSNNSAAGIYCTVGGGQRNAAGTNDGDSLTGAHATVGGGDGNHAKADDSVVAGGQENQALGSNSSVVGGYSNEAGGDNAAIGGGQQNAASGNQATIPGGNRNRAGGDRSFAAGDRAKAADDNAFVWNDGSFYHDFGGTVDGFSSTSGVAGSGVTGFNTFNVSASQGVRFVTSDSTVTYISAAGSGWNTSSSRTAKTNVEPVDPGAVLEGVESMEVSTWEYDDGDGGGRGVRHVGPMAEEFHAELPIDVGDDDEHINSINADGLAFAAIQGLSAELDDRDDRIEAQRERIERQQQRIDDLERRLNDLEGESGSRG